VDELIGRLVAAVGRGAVLTDPDVRELVSELGITLCSLPEALPDYK